MPERAPVAVAILARNAARTIGGCLDSVVPFVQECVVCVDATCQDDTARVAFAHGAKVVTGHQVSEWHECPDHGRVLAQHFGRARDEAFKLLRQDLEWWAWVDADDVLRGGEKLAGFLAHVPPELVGVWLPYQYSSTPNGLASTRFDRERILRRSVGWRWQHRVHEVAAPIGRESSEVPWLRTDDIVVVHQDQGHDTRASARRNILLLEIELEERPGDPWALQYLGNQYFALEKWAEAIGYYEASLETPNVYQKWLTCVYRSMAHEKLGQLLEAEDAALDAVRVRPEHPEPYYRLAAVKMLMGDARACETWTRIGDQMEAAPGVVFQNPMDRPYNARVTLGQALHNDGQISRARREWERAYAVVPNETIKAGIEACRGLEADAQHAEALLRVLAGRPDEEVTRLWQALAAPEQVRAFGRLRDLVMPAILRQRPTSQARIVFWCGRSVEPWAPPSLETTGIGGSETAVVQIARRFARQGWRVDVYNEPDRMEGEYDTVGYWGLARLGADERAEVLVSWRNPRAHGLPVAARRRLLWSHDLNSGPGLAPDLSRWDRVLAVSRWHRDYLAYTYGLTNVDYVPNGIDLDRFEPGVAKVPFRCVYASAPDRGLVRLLHLWPAIVASEPAAELHVAYGWQTVDRYIALGATHLVALKEEVQALLARTPRVVWRDRLPQSELARLYQESYAWLYPSHFLEVSCISAMEAMAGGAVPVASAAGALPETVGEAGMIVPGSVYSQAWGEFYANVARAVMSAPDLRVTLARRGRERAQELTWDRAFGRWLEVLGEEPADEWTQATIPAAASGATRALV